MRDDYSYHDPDYQYTDSKTGVLRNLHSINDRDMLNLVESGASTKRANELLEYPIKIKGTETLLEIHRCLFQDIYEWAGKLRTVEISKSGRQFFPSNKFEKGFAHINTLIADYVATANDDSTRLSNLLSIILDSVNYLHPFREGNGRTQREFIRLLALEKGYLMNLNPPDNSDIFERYMTGTIDGDIPKLQALMLELMEQGKITNNI
jgi:cell filamentation protein